MLVFKDYKLKLVNMILRLLQRLPFLRFRISFPIPDGYFISCQSFIEAHPSVTIQILGIDKSKSFHRKSGYTKELIRNHHSNMKNSTENYSFCAKKMKI